MVIRVLHVQKKKCLICLPCGKMALASYIRSTIYNLNLVTEQGYTGIILAARKYIDQDLSIKSTKNELVSTFVFLPPLLFKFYKFTYA